MEDGYGGAKPKTKTPKTAGKRDEPSTTHTCSKEKHKRKKDSARSRKNLDEYEKHLINGSDKIPNDLIVDIDDSSHFCNGFTSLAESGFHRGNRDMARETMDVQIPSFMPHSNFQEADIFDDVEHTRGDSGADYSINSFDGLKGCHNKIDKTMISHADPSTNNVKRKTAIKQSENVRKKDLVRDKNEIVKMHEDSLREKWKKSGLALRKFLSERLGFNSKKEHLKEESRLFENRKCNDSIEEGRLKGCSSKTYEKNETLNRNEKSGVDGNKDDRELKKAESEEDSRKKHLSEVQPVKKSRSMISKLKLSFKSKKKKDSGDMDSSTPSDCSYPSSPAKSSSSTDSNGVVNPNVDHFFQNQSCDLSHSKLNGALDELNLVARLNLNGNSTLYSCNCLMCQETRAGSKKRQQKLGNNSKKPWFHRKGSTDASKEKTKKLKKVKQSKKREYIGVLDNELSSSGDEVPKNGRPVMMKRHQKDYSRERLSSNSQDTLTPENTPPRNTSDVLSTLHYAIPYLPPRLRSQLGISREGRNGGSGDNQNKESSKRHCLKVKPRHETVVNDSRSDNSFYDNNIDLLREGENIRDRVHVGSHDNFAQNKVASKRPCSKGKPRVKTEDDESKHNQSFYDNYSIDVRDDELVDLDNVDKDWENVILDTERCSRVTNTSQARNEGISAVSRTNGEVGDILRFPRTWLRQGSERNESVSRTNGGVGDLLTFPRTWVRSGSDRHEDVSRTNGEVGDFVRFSRLRPKSDTSVELFRNSLIDSIDEPLMQKSDTDLETEDKVELFRNRLIDSTDEPLMPKRDTDFETKDKCSSESKNDDVFESMENFLEDLVNGMDRICTDEEDDFGTENGCFIPEEDATWNKHTNEGFDRSDDISWSPLPLSESCDEADDEFECDCEHCSLLRHRSSSVDVIDLTDGDAEHEALRQQRRDEMIFGAENEALLPDPYIDGDIFNINVLELTSLDFMLMAESTFRLDIMLENVIQQMLAVQPELLNDHAIPPAHQCTIDNLSTLKLTEDHLEQNPACPICLCPCEIEEIMTSLSCSHLFHPLCIQAWLAKSGTCPVCRSPV